MGLIKVAEETVKFRLENNVELPKKSTEGSVGYDIKALISNKDLGVIFPNESKLISTGVYVSDMPENMEIQVRSRSGMSLKKGLIVLNSPGTIDPDYRGEIKVILHNVSHTIQVVSNKDKIAQLVFKRFENVNMQISEDINKTLRNEDGFGSTGN